MDLWVGTSGFAYREWKGPFYPEELPDDEMLRYYGERLPAVEINNTFYRMPRAEVLEGWASRVPDGFRFVLKASRRITHFKRLVGAEEDVGYLVRTASALRDRAGAILYQLPPNLPADPDRLETFLAALPNPGRSAFEFRHPSWETEEVDELLRACGAARCVADVDDAPEPELSVTSEWTYLRLRRASYEDADLARWADRLSAAGVEGAYVFFKHEDAGEGPRLAARFLEIAGGGAAEGRRSGEETP